MIAIADRQLTRNFWLSEAPCWTHATEAQAGKLQETAARVLQPVRNVFGRTIITSWMFWRNGCTPRTGTHAQGGTIDFDVPGKTEEVWEWGNTFLMPTGYIGRWIFEPETPNQGAHIHMAPRADMIAHNGDGRIQSLRELPDGDVFVFREWDGGTFVNPYQIPGITAYGTARAGMPTWAALGLLFALFTADMSWQAGR